MNKSVYQSDVSKYWKHPITDVSQMPANAGDLNFNIGGIAGFGQSVSNIAESDNWLSVLGNTVTAVANLVGAFL